MRDVVRSAMSRRRSRRFRSSCRSVSRPRMARLPHDLDAAIESGISMEPDTTGRLASWPPRLFLALAIEAAWWKRAAGVVPA